VDKKFKILLVDRNRNVRNFLQRELSGEGYQVVLAGDDKELLQLLQSDNTSYLLILDPDIPSGLTKSELIKMIHFRHPDLPIVIHTILTDDCNYPEMDGVVGCLEKGEDTGYLKKLIAEVIQK
jgi:DNA-binding NtrC family response regulator